MSEHDAFQMEIEEPLAIRVEEPHSTRKYNISSWFQRIITLDGVPNQKHHPPVFIIVMSILHVCMYLLPYIVTSSNGQHFVYTLYDLCKFFGPCMRPTPHDIRTRIVNCPQSMKYETCHYDDVLKHMCSSFMYPHQIWRMISVNVLHMRWLHLLSNLLVQLLPGLLLERKYGSVRMIVIYWLSGLGASLILVMKDKGEPANGASGSLYGLMLFLVVDRLITIQTNSGRRLFIIIQLALLLLPHIIASIPFIIKYNVGHSAHIGGGLVGFLLGICMFDGPWPWNNKHYISRTTCQRTAFVFLILYYIIFFTIFFMTDAPTVNSILNK